MTKSERQKYLKTWRAAHPHYSRDYMRSKRTECGWAYGWPEMWKRYAPAKKQQVTILGVRVYLKALGAENPRKGMA